MRRWGEEGEGEAVGWEGGSQAQHGSESGSGVRLESPSHCAALRANRQQARARVRERGAPAVASARQATAKRCPQLALSQHLGRGAHSGGHVTRCGVHAIERSLDGIERSLVGIARCDARTAERSLPGVVGGGRSRLGGGVLGGGTRRPVVAKRRCGGARRGLWALPRRGGGEGDLGSRCRRGRGRCGRRCGRRSLLALIEALVVVGEVVHRSPRGEVDGSGRPAAGGWGVDGYRMAPRGACLVRRGGVSCHMNGSDRCHAPIDRGSARARATWAQAADVQDVSRRRRSA